VHPQRPEQPVLHRPSQWFAIDLLGDEAEKRVVGVVVFVGGTRRKLGGRANAMASTSSVVQTLVGSRSTVAASSGASV
jgi:hypothetical protein